ncbi:CatB-related O-acetyltransferase [Magnetovibrio sp.]|uniref:CatB-related O-acetyltransferase n=1 Tax=Magnetovibrio sp. TaxID=2024836 RepID=UPI002F9477A1
MPSSSTSAPLRAPDPDTPYPLPNAKRVVFLKPHITRPNISVGDFTYYDSPIHPEHFQDDNVLYHYEAQGDRLIIGKYCALAHGVTFIMNGANHRMDGVSTYPFPIFGASWGEHMDLLGDLPSRGDTRVGNDVWLGMEAMVMPGVTIGDGAIVAARAVVTSDVAPYTIVAGNPAQVVRERVSPADAQRLVETAWWDWPTEIVNTHIRTLMTGDADKIIGVFNKLKKSTAEN